MARTSTWAAPRVIVVPIWTCQCGILGTPTETGRYQTLSESSERPLGSGSGCQSLSKIKTTDLFPGFFLLDHIVTRKKAEGGLQLRAWTYMRYVTRQTQQNAKHIKRGEK